MHPLTLLLLGALGSALPFNLGGLDGVDRVNNGLAPRRGSANTIADDPVGERHRSAFDSGSSVYIKDIVYSPARNNFAEKKSGRVNTNEGRNNKVIRNAMPFEVSIDGGSQLHLEGYDDSVDRDLVSIKNPVNNDRKNTEKDVVRGGLWARAIDLMKDLQRRRANPTNTEEEDRSVSYARAETSKPGHDEIDCKWDLVWDDVEEDVSTTRTN